jgi:HlyD family secretion protein
MPSARTAPSIVAAIALLVAIWAWAPAALWAQSPNKEPKPKSVAVATVRRDSIAGKQPFVGTVQPTRRVMVGSAVDGRVMALRVEAGERVAADQPLADLLRRTLEIERDGAKAQLTLREAELAELVNGSLPAERDAAKARVSLADASVAYAKTAFERIEKLQQISGVSQDEFEQMLRLLRQAQQQQAEAISQEALVIQGPRAERIAQARAQVEIQRQAVALLEDRLEKYTIRMPFDGYVVAELAERGAWVKQGDPIVEVMELQTVEIEVDIPENQLAALHVGDSVPVRVSAIANVAFEGTIVRIVPLADLQSRTFPVKIRVSNQIDSADQPLLRAGMLASADLPIESPRTVLLIPKDALRLGTRPVTIACVEDQKAKIIPVVPGSAMEDFVEIQPLQGHRIDEQTVVVVRGNEELTDNEPVVIDAGRSEEATNADRSTAVRN